MSDIVKKFTWRERLKSIMRQKNIKVTKMSLALGFNRDYLSRITNNPKSNPEINKLESICEYLEITIAQLMSGEDLYIKKERAGDRISKMGESDIARLTEHMKKNSREDNHS